MHPKRSSTLVECLQRAVTPQLASSLQHYGFAIADNVFGDKNCQLLQQEAQALRDMGQMHANCTHLVRGGERKLLEKAEISEADLLQKSTLEATVQFSQLQADTSLRTMLSLFLPKLRLDSQAIKVQFNAGGGGCFPIHFDSDEAVDSRRVTAIVYLNRKWRGSDGGQLRLYPDLKSHIDIEPINDRLLLFSSCRMPHRVLPSAAERYCFTIWLSQTRLARKPPTPLAKVVETARGRGHPPSEALLGEPELRKCLAKLAYADEWIQSLEESHAASAARTHVIDSFRDELKFLQEQLGPVFPDGVASKWKHISALHSRHSAAWF